MTGMRLVADPALRASTGSFGAKVEGGELRVPPEVYRLAKGWSAMTAERFYSSADALIGAAAGIAFGWSPDAARQAIDELAALLKGHVPDAVLLARGARSAPPASFVPPPDYAEVFGEITAGPAPEELKVDDGPKVVIDGLPPADGFEE